MSALQQLLQQHSADIDARIQHTNDIDNEISDRKANTLEEKFQNAKDSIEAVGAELGTAGGAFHMGRKVFTKYKQRQARLAKEKSSSGDSASSKSAERPAAEGEPANPTGTATDDPAAIGDRLDRLVSEGAKPEAEPAAEPAADPDSQPGSAPKQGADDPITKDDSFSPDSKTSPEADDIFRTGDFPDLPKAPLGRTGGMATGTGDAPAVPNAPTDYRKAQSAEEAKDPESHTQPKASESQPAQDTSNPATAEGQQSRAATVESNQAEAPTGTEEANPMESLNTRTNTPLQTGGSEPATPATSEANVGSAAEGAAEEGGARSATAATTQAGGSTATDVEEGARAFMDPATGAAKSAANIASRAADNSSIIDKGINGAKKVGSAIKGGLGGDLSEGSSILPEVGEALDFLGPIGEFAGLITGLVGLFEGIGHKKAEPKTISGQSGGVALTQAGGGIDTHALLSQAPKALMGAV